MAYLISHFWHGWAAVRREWPGGRVAESLDESEYLQLISAARVGRLGYTSRYGPAVLPVVYKLHEGSIVFHTLPGIFTEEDLRTGIAHTEYEVAFEGHGLLPAGSGRWRHLDPMSST